MNLLINGKGISIVETARNLLVFYIDLKKHINYMYAKKRI